MGTLGTRTRNGNRPAARRVARTERAHPSVAKLALAQEQLKEALEQQAATADILRALARSTADAQPVFEAIVEHAHRLCGAVFSILYSYDGQLMNVVADRVSAEASRILHGMYPAAPRRDHIVGRCILEGRVVHSADVPNDPRFPANRNAFMKAVPFRAGLEIPLLRDGTVLGAIAVGRLEPKPFSKREIALLKTFADQAVIAIQNARLFNETREALEHQKASAEVLRIVAGSVEDTAPVFKAITEAGMRLLPGSRVALFLERDGQLHYASHSGITDELRKELAKRWPAPLDRKVVAGASILDKRVIHIADMLAEGRKYPHSLAIARASGYRALICVPLIRGRKAIGCISIARAEAGFYTEKQVALAQTFAEQAVIAIQNAKMFREIQERNAELKQSLEFQAASGEILASISSSISNTNPVFDALVRNVVKLFRTKYAAVFMLEGEQLELAALQGDPFSDGKFAASFPQPVDYGTLTGKALATGKVMQLAPIVGNPEASEQAVELARRSDYNAMIIAPMVREGRVIGAIGTARSEPIRFDEKQVALLKAFADQAVIAIENARLFNETKEALEQQTATGEILRVIASSPSDVQPVFDTIARNVSRLCNGNYAIVTRFDGELVHLVAQHNPRPGADAPTAGSYPRPPSRALPALRAVLERAVVHIPHANQDPDLSQEVVAKIGAGSFLAVPMLRDGLPIGAIGTSRVESGPFPEKQIELVKLFADQAVIAIENVRLLNETKESLERQTATAEILRVISSTPTDTQPVFKAIVQATQRLMAGNRAVLLLRKDTRFVVAATSAAVTGDLPQQVLDVPLDRDQNFPSRAILDGVVVHVPDWQADEVPEFEKGVGKAYGVKSGVIVPLLLRDGTGIGALAVARDVAGLYLVKEIALLQSFAAQAVIAIENVRLFNETKEALEQQTATSQVLSVISSSPTDVAPTYRTILDNVTRLCEANIAALFLYDGEFIRSVAHHNATAAFGKQLDELRVKPSSETPTRLAALERRIVHVADVLSDPAFSLSEAHRQEQPRTVLSVPLLREAALVGVITVWRREPRLFTDKQVALVKTFADQAVIAIENVRLFNETKEALERQTAISEVLRAISGSPTDVKPVLEAVAVRAARICEASDARIFLVDGEHIRHAAGFGDAPAPMDVSLDRGSVVGRAIVDRVPMHVDDVKSLSPDEFPISRKIQERIGHRTMLAVPLMREDRALGAILLRRMEVRPFTDKQVALLKTFGDQAAIAIENVRLFNETKESLEQQTATSEILKVISSSPTETQPVFEAIVQSAARLFAPSNIALVMREGEVLQRKARAGPTSSQVDQAKVASIYPLPLDPERSMVARSVLERRVIEIPDTEAEGLPGILKSLGRAAGYRAITLVPLIREGEGIGVIGLNRSKPGFKLTDKQLALVRTFADQAVIAIENVRLFKELQDRNRALTEALEQQTATGEILKTISSATSDVQPVFDTIIRNAVRLGGGSFGAFFLFDGRLVDLAAHYNFPPEVEAMYRRAFPQPPSRDNPVARAILERTLVNVADIHATDYSAAAKNRAHEMGTRAVLAVPMMREQTPVGVIAVIRPEPGGFSDSYIALLQTFAAQAVIAVENVRLFNEINEALRLQTSTAEVLKTISRSTFDLEAVLQTLLDNATRLSGAARAVMFRPDAAGNYLPAVTSNYPADSPVIARLRERPIRPGHDSTSGRVLLERKPIHIPDVLADREYRRRDLVDAGAFRTVLSVPMLRDGEAIGLITLNKGPEVDPFTGKQIELVTTFADQAVIAIENVRLFKEIEEKSAQLEVANKHKSDFLASMSHELRTPLNALLGFNEMILGDIYGEVPADMKPPLVQMQASGKHLLRLINNVLDLAKIEAGRMELALSDYSVHDIVESVRSTLQPLARDKGLDFLATVPADIPLAHGDPGRITQCLMNLAGNSLKFTKAGKVEISVALDDGRLRYCVADTGIGIPPEKIGSLFTEFRQTDATIASEYGGTGLGLSISKKFVELHGGRIWAQSEPGRGTAFTFEVPLRAATA